MLPSATTTLNTAFPLPSGERPRNAVPPAARPRAPGMICAGWRPVRLPKYTPPVVGLGAPTSGAPSGSSIVDDPGPSRPYGAFAGQSRPNALLIDSASGLLTAGWLGGPPPPGAPRAPAPASRGS